MIDTWPLLLAGVVVSGAIVLFAGLAVAGAHRSYSAHAPLAFFAWAVFIVCCPLAGPLAWFVWNGWLSDSSGFSICSVKPLH